MLQELTNKIKKIIPEIEDFDKYDIVNGVEGKSLYKNDKRIAGNKPWGGGTSIAEFKVERPITLEDVLRCLNKSLNSSYQIRDTGEILIMGIPSDIYWTFGKPLHEQSEETIKALNKLI